jgi:hypothetical protein
MEHIKIYQTTLTMSEVIKSTVALFFLNNDIEHKRLPQQWTSCAILIQDTKIFYDYLIKNIIFLYRENKIEITKKIGYFNLSYYAASEFDMKPNAKMRKEIWKIIANSVNHFN